MLMLSQRVKTKMTVVTVDDDEENEADDAVHLRWTGVNTLLSTQLQLTHTMTVRGPHTTWVTPMAKTVTFFTPCLLASHLTTS